MFSLAKVKHHTNLGLVLSKPNTLAREAMLVISGALFTALCAQLVIPLHPVPVTLQTFAVLLCGVMLGPKLGTLSQLIYIGAGACGAPVFAGAVLGTATALGPTIGYLLSFPLAAAALGWLAAKGWDRNVWRMLAAMGVAEAIILISGTAWLSFYVGGLANAWRLGAEPFLLVEVVKAMVLVLMIPAAWKVLNSK